MEAQLRHSTPPQLALYARPSSAPRSAFPSRASRHPTSAAPQPVSETTQLAVKNLRNHLMVFFSATAWVRSRRGVWPDAVSATSEMERAADSLRGVLQVLIAALEHTADAEHAAFTARLLREAATSVHDFHRNADQAMTPLRRGLALCGTDGHELLADLEGAMLRVRDAAQTLRDATTA